MKKKFPFSLIEIRTQVDSEQIGFKLYGDKTKPVHFANGFFRYVLGEYSTANLLARLAYVVNAKGQIKKGCEIETIMQELKEDNIIEDNIKKEDVQSLRRMMQSLLSTDSAVFGEIGAYVSYSAASLPFVTTKAPYEEIGEIGGAILKKACPDLSNFLETLLRNEKDEISILFNPIPNDINLTKDNCGELPNWTKNITSNKEWENYLSSINRSGMLLLENVKGLPKLNAIRIIVHFAIFHMIRYLAKQEAFHDNTASATLPIVAVFSKKRNSPLISSSRTSFLQIGQSLARFYTLMYTQKFKEYDFTYNDLISILEAPSYNESKVQTMSSKKKEEQNNEVWRTAKIMSKEEEDKNLALLGLGQAIYQMVATASDVNPMKYIRGLALKSGIIYPLTSRVTPYFKFSQDIIAMLVMSSAKKGQRVPGEELLLNLRENFDIVTGALSDDFIYCTNYLRAVGFDEDELSKNGEAFISQICDIGYGEVLADGIFRVLIGE